MQFLSDLEFLGSINQKTGKARIALCTLIPMQDNRSVGTVIWSNVPDELKQELYDYKFKCPND